MNLSKPTRHTWAGCCAILLALAGCSGAHESRHVPVANVAHAQVAPTADVPALLGASIDGLRHRLGPVQPMPASLWASKATIFVDDSAGAPDSVATFRTGGLTVVANYDIRSRQVRDLLLIGQHEDSLMGRANLRANADNYLILPVFYKNSYRLLGLRIIDINTTLNSEADDKATATSKKN